MWVKSFGDTCCVLTELCSVMGQNIITLEYIINISLALAEMGVLCRLICVLCGLIFVLYVFICCMCVNLFYVG